MNPCDNCGTPTRSHRCRLRGEFAMLSSVLDEPTTLTLCHTCYKELNAERGLDAPLAFEEDGEYYINENAVDELDRVLREVGV